MTLLEVVLSVLLLSLVAATVTAAISSITGMESRNRQRLGAYELGNRLLLQFIDDEEALPDPALPLEYGPSLYFWDMSQSPMKMDISGAQQSSGANLLGLDRYRLLNVTVYGANVAREIPTRAEPLASISRVYDPVLPRNPDSMQALGSDVNKITERIIKPLLGGGTPK